MVADDLPGDGEPEAAAAGGAVAGRVGAPEPLEHERQVGGGDPAAGVVDLDDDPVRVGKRA
ncbi:hypothetical protein GCM10027610_068060 [Dactylosporangium cerinum]